MDVQSMLGKGLHLSIMPGILAAHLIGASGEAYHPWVELLHIRSDLIHRVALWIDGDEDWLDLLSLSSCT